MRNGSRGEHILVVPENMLCVRLIKNNSRRESPSIKELSSLIISRQLRMGLGEE